MSYPRRQQFRRLSRAGTAAIGTATAALLAVGLANAGAAVLAGLLLIASVVLGFSTRRWLVLAEASRVGARSEDEVRRVLAPLRSEDWRMRHSLSWRGRGDIDSVAIAPGGVGFAIEVKTSAYEYRQLVVVRKQAA